MENHIKTSWIVTRSSIHSKLTFCHQIISLPKFHWFWGAAHTCLPSVEPHFTHKVFFYPKVCYFFSSFASVFTFLKNRLGILNCVPLNPAWCCHRSVMLLWWCCRLCRTMLLMMPLVGTLAEANKHTRQPRHIFIDAAAGINYIASPAIIELFSFLKMFL